MQLFLVLAKPVCTYPIVSGKGMSATGRDYSVSPSGLLPSAMIFAFDTSVLFHGNNFHIT
jgi:hypothetical protein